MIKRNLIGLLLFFLASISVQAQSWQKIYPDASASTEVVAVTQTSDGGYAVLEHLTSPNSQFNWEIDTLTRVVKLNAQGSLLWRKNIVTSTTTNQDAISIQETPDSNLLICYREYVTNHYGSSLAYTLTGMKLNSIGDVIWTKSFNTSSEAGLNRSNAIITSDGNYLFVSNTTQLYVYDSQVDKVSPQGNVIWTKNYTTQQSRKAVPLPNNEFALIGINSPTNSFIETYDAQGNLNWSKGTSSSYGLQELKNTHDNGFISLGDETVISWVTSIYNPLNVTRLDSTGTEVWKNGFATFGKFIAIEVIEDSNYIIIERKMDTLQNKSVIHKIDDSGNIIWTKDIVDPNIIGFIPYQFNTLYVDKHDNILIGGSYNNHFAIWKLNANGEISSTKIDGNVYFDINNDCTKNTGEIDLPLFVIEAVQNGSYYYSLTDSAGNYSMPVDTGEAIITSYAPTINPYWQICNGGYSVTLSNYGDSATVDIGMQAIVQCPSTLVDISIPVIRQCCPSTYYVNYHNFGTQDAQNAFIDVTLDDDLLFVGSSIPNSSQVGNVYTFPVGNLAIGQSGQFTIDVFLDTTSNLVLGQTHCTEAHIFPDTICVPSMNWNGAMVTVDGTCDADTVRFKIKNVGTSNMSQQLKYFVIEDNLIMSITPYQLNQGDSLLVDIPTNGSTYRIVAEQEPNHPYSQYPTAHVEACNNNGNPSIGFVNIFPNDDGAPFLDIDCTQNIDSYDPNDKQANPIGIGASHDIFQNVAIDYMIRFQNTGTDTAFNIVIEDEIDTDLLDITSIQFGASSHAYQASIVGQNLVKFTFANIMLPDSNVNQVTSNGFVKFKINQQVDNDFGSLIENTAAIYFDFNLPIITNTTFHTVTPFPLNVSTNTPALPEVTHITVFPNPFLEKATFRVDDEQPRNLQFTVYDVTGRIVHEQYYEQTYQFEFYKNQMTSGMYFYTLRENGKNINQGKIVIQ